MLPLDQLLPIDQCIAPQPVAVYKKIVFAFPTGEPLAQGALPEPEAARLGSPLSGKGCEPSRGDSPVSNSILTFWCLFSFCSSLLLICLFLCLLLVLFPCLCLIPTVFRPNVRYVGPTVRLQFRRERVVDKSTLTFYCLFSLCASLLLSCLFLCSFLFLLFFLVFV